MIKQIDDELYQVVCGWWKDRGIPLIKRRSLPRHSYVLCHNDRPVIFGCFYKDEVADVGFLGWIVSDKNADKEIRNGMYDYLINYLEKTAKEAGVNSLLAIGKFGTIDDRLASHGYFRVQENATHYYLKEI